MVFKDISGIIGEGQKVGLVGRNGQGKTTLMKIFIGQEEPDEGIFEVQGRIGYLAQQMDELEGSLAEFLGQDGAREYQIKKALARVQLSEALLHSKLETLSGGEKTKARIARLLLREPDILMLDEPTNHLDMKALNWLEGFLSSFAGIVLVISHDRAFLDRAVGKIFELEGGKLQEYTGNYSEYKRQKQQLYDRQLEEYKVYTEQRKKLEEAIRKKMEKAQRVVKKKRPRDSGEARGGKDFYAAKAKRVAQNAKAMERRLEKLEKKEKPREQKKIKVSFGLDGEVVSQTLIRGQGLKKQFGSRLLFADVQFEVNRGKRIALLGDNGSGKTTLLKMIMGELEPDEGTVKAAPGVQIGYLDQELARFQENRSILEELSHETGKKEEEIRTLLGCLQFRRDEVYKPIGVLSMGERVKVTLARLILQGSNILILDEPTNHLDLPSREAVEEALENYDGTLLFVSHDRYFLERIADEIWEIKDKRLERHEMSYREYLEEREGTSRNQDAQRLLLENRLSQLSALLDVCKDEAEKEELNREFIEIARKLRELK